MSQPYDFPDTGPYSAANAEHDSDSAQDIISDQRHETEYTDQRDDFCWAIKDTGLNVDLIAQSLFIVLDRDQVSQVINRLNKKLDA